ncbi:MAG TPA: DUF4118 domain-containing protein [Spirochaetales bacterium]|nr:DUF4118 domain-containing protein [Spirochaetales bacterium]
MTQADTTRLARNEKKCVAIGITSAPNSVRLVKKAYELARSTDASLLGIHIDAGATPAREDKERLDNNLDLVRSLGGEVVVAVSPDPVQGLVSTALAHGASTLVIGRSGLSRLGPIPHHTTLSDRILHEASPLDVVVISDTGENPPDLTFASLRRYFRAPLHQYLLLCFAFVAVTAACALLSKYLGTRSVPIMYLTVVLLLSTVSAPGPIAIFAVISALAYNFFFLPPHYSFAITSIEDIFIFVLYFIVAWVSGALSSGLRTREKLLEKKDQSTTLLLAAANSLAKANSVQEAASVTAELVQSYTKSTAIVFVPSDPRIEQEETLYAADGVADAVAKENSIPNINVQRLKEECRQVILSGKVNDYLVNDYPLSVVSAKSKLHFRFVPASSGQQVVAVIVYARTSSKSEVEEDDELIAAIGRSLALVIERTQSQKRNQQAALELESERLAKVLFDSVSHELKTPLTTILGSLSVLADSTDSIPGVQQKELLEQSFNAAKKLNQTVEDFLSIGRIESGRLTLKLEPIEHAELLAMITNAFKGKENDHPLQIIPFQANEIVEYNIDAVLIARATGILLENAAKYSVPGGIIELAMAPQEPQGKNLSIIVHDEGPGFSSERMQSPFVKFRKVPGDKPGGVGLGLPICQGIVTAHGGSMVARRDTTGFLVEIIIPNCVEIS